MARFSLYQRLHDAKSGKRLRYHFSLDIRFHPIVAASVSFVCARQTQLVPDEFFRLLLHNTPSYVTLILLQLHSVLPLVIYTWWTRLFSSREVDKKGYFWNNIFLGTLATTVLKNERFYSGVLEILFQLFSHLHLNTIYLWETRRSKRQQIVTYKKYRTKLNFIF